MKIQDASKPANPGVFVWGVVFLAVLAMPLRIVQHGFLPPDDGLRHAAKAVSGKSWQEILVMRPDITIDHNPGWHWTLEKVHRATGWNTRELVQFSIVAMFTLFAVAPLPWLRRPEAWLGALAVVMLVFPYFAVRAFVGRPLFVTMAITLVLLCVWTRAKGERIPPKLIAVSISLMALSTWMHGSWYLLVLLPTVFLFAGMWRRALALGGCWLMGTMVGGLLTGQPVTFLHQSGLIPLLALGQTAPVDSLVGEFQPFTGGYPALVVVGVVLAWRKLSGRTLGGLWRDPVLWMAFLGWLLGFRVLRFWLDWGIPAFALWLARQFDELLEAHLPGSEWWRLIVSSSVAVVLVFGVANDGGARWSQYGKWEALDASRLEHAEWLPEAGGILYNVNLSVFYETFFTNPQGEWRYALGFEPSFMTRENLAVYQELWGTLNAVRACAAWVEKMRPEDRLVLVSGPHPAPAIPRLEWHYAAANTWVGRLPKGGQ